MLNVRHYLKTLFTSALLVLLNIVLFAQNSVPEIKKSTDKVLISGKVYFVHVVNKGETLYSIAKAYNVTVSDVIANNPSAVTEIKPEQVLRIPELAVHAGELDTRKEKGQILHVVSAGQTLYSISRMYGISVAEIEQMNPEVKIDSLQVNQVLKVSQILKNKEKDEQSTGEFIYHTVEKKETLFSISKKYDISQEDILKYNETVANEGLKKGKDIRIPVKKPVVASIPEPKPVEVKTDVVIENVIVPCDSLHSLTQKQIKIALLMPLFASGTMVSEQDDENQNDEKIQQKQSEEFNPISMNFLEFYQGVLLALDELKKKGLDINLYVFDTEKDVNKLDDILKDKNLAACNLIIGPAFPEQVKIVAEFAKQHQIFLISPVAHHEELLTENPYLFQVNPGAERELKAVTKILVPDSVTNVVVMYSGAMDNLGKYNQFKSILDETLLDKRSKICEISVFNNDFAEAKKKLDSLRTNIVFSPETDEIFVTSLLGSIESKLVDYKATTIGLMDWTRYKGADMNYLFDQQLIYHTAFFLDYSSPLVKAFLKNFRVMFGTEPFKLSKYGFNYSMLGFDIANFFATGYAFYGSSLRENIACVKTHAVIAPLEFKQVNPSGGYSNCYLQSVQYGKDYQLVRSSKK